MKHSQVFLTCMLSLALLVSPGLTDSNCSTSNNPFFLAAQKTGGLKLFSAPQKIPGYCGGEWEVHGGCCDVESLKKYVSTDSAMQTAATTQLLTVVKNVRSILSTHANLLKQWSIFVGLKVHPKLAKFEQILTPLAEKDYIGNFVKCWTRGISDYRSASACYYCSGRSEEFILGSKTLITQKTCSTIISECFLSLQEILDFLEALDFVWQLLEKVGKVFKLPTGLNINALNVRLFMNQSEIIGLHKVFQGYTDTIGDLSKINARHALETFICHKFLNICSQTMIQRLESFFGQAVTTLKNLPSLVSTNMVSLWSGILALQPITSLTSLAQARSLTEVSPLIEGDTCVFQSPTLLANQGTSTGSGSDLVVAQPDPTVFAGKQGQALTEVHFP